LSRKLNYRRKRRVQREQGLEIATQGGHEYCQQ
jgi:hypothetical protein